MKENTKSIFCLIGVQEIGVLIFLFLLCTYPAFSQPLARQGVLDLSEVNLSSTTTVPLNGDWTFFWNELIPPHRFDSNSREAPRFKMMPHLWNEDPELDSYGYATYSLKILLPEQHPPLALTIPDMYTAYSLFINGVEISKNGEVAESRENYLPYWLPRTISIDQFNSNELELVLQIANFRHSKGGIRLPIVIGKEDVLQKKRDIELGYMLLLAGSVFVTGLIFLGLYLFGRHEKPILFFAIFCLTFTYRIIGTELYPLHYLFPEIPWIFTIRAEYFSLYFSAVIFGLFVLYLYPKEASKKIIYALSAIFSVFSLSSLVLPPYYFTQLINPFFVLIPVYIIYTVWVYIHAALHKREGSGFALASTVALFFVFIHNLLEYYVIVDENLAISFVGFFSFFFFQALILSYRFTNSLNRAKIQAEEAAKAKSQFLSTMSHEIRTPLNAVIGLSELLIESDSEKEKKEFARTIKSSGENLLEIINNILDYSKFESSEIELDNSAVELEALIKEVINLLSPLYIPKKLDINLKISPDIPKWILTDSTRLKQILINLIGNSIKFTPEGNISITVQKNDRTYKAGNLLFEITDTGMGIPEDKMSRLFKSFSQVETGLTREFGGTGLGLVISQKLVQAMNGNIWVQSKEHVGTTFHFTIEAHAAEKPKDVELSTGIEEVQNYSNENLRVLLAEDNLINQKVVIKILEKVHLKPDIVTNGFEAVSRLKEQNYDLIFMDMEMPVMDGIEATREIRSLSNSTQTQPVIVAMTANAFAEDREKCLQAGMNDFIAKPISVTTVRKVIKKWFA